MRLAYLCTDPGVVYGATKGASVHLAELADALAGEGAHVLLLVAAAAPDAPAPAPGVALEVIPGPGRGAPARRRLAFERERASWLEGRLRRFGAGFLYERLALHSSAGLAAARALEIPHIVELNAPLPEEAARYRRLELPEAALELERTVLAGADLVLPVSRPLSAYALERGARRVEVLPNAVNVAKFPSRPARAERPPLAVFTGSLRPWHGIETIGEAWRRLDRAAPRLLVVGGGRGQERLEALGAHVTGPVYHAQVPALLGSAHIGLAPYAADAPRYFSPLKLFEYLAAGLAVIAADLPGVSDVVAPEAVLLIPPGDADLLAEAVLALTTDAPRRERLGKAGRALVAAEHTWERRARTILALSAELAASKSSNAPGALPADAARLRGSVVG